MLEDGQPIVTAVSVEHMRVPLDGEVAWLLPEGAKPYWRGRITKLRYEFAQCSKPIESAASTPTLASFASLRRCVRLMRDVKRHQNFATRLRHQ